jgi:hypothetical protein
MLYPLSYAGTADGDLGDPSGQILANAPARVYALARAD